MSDPLAPDIESELYRLIRQFFASRTSEPFVAGESPIRLAVPTYGSDEVIQVLQSLLTGQMTMNQHVANKVGAFEELWARYIGVSNGVMTNSGSSANLLALSLLAGPEVPRERRLMPGDEVITSAVTWTTTVSPIYQVGARPVFVDARVEDFNIDPAHIEAAISGRVKAIMPVHLLGNPCDMVAIRDIADRHGLWIIEDSCEAHGAEWHGRRVGSFGDLSTFSFFFSHHLSTIEGGMVMTNNDAFAEQLRAMRSQGVLRNMRQADQYLEKLYATDESYRDLDTRYLFVTLGYNVRPTELNGGFGIEQVKKIDDIILARQQTAAFYRDAFRNFARFFRVISEWTDCRHVYFGYPIVIREDAPFRRKEFVAFLEQHGIETRPIMTGLVTKHPALRSYPYREMGELPVARMLHEGGVFLGTHAGIGEQERSYVVETVAEFLRGYDR